MKNIVLFVLLSVMVVPAGAATPMGNGRRAIETPVTAAARKVEAGKIASMKYSGVNANVTENVNEKSSVRVEDVVAEIPQQPEIDNREKEKAACIQNNIGVGNTFVWASRYSNINDYSTMVEDTENPENNTCFVKVSLKSNDSRIDLGDIKGQYFEMGRNITCGAWADEGDIEKRILNAKKTGRAWATVGGAVGGAAIGVGSMELFGNKLIGGKVEGQEALTGNELLRSQLLVLKDNDVDAYNKFITQLKALRDACNGSKDSSKCTEYKDLYDLID